MYTKRSPERDDRAVGLRAGSVTVEEYGDDEDEDEDDDDDDDDDDEEEDVALSSLRPAKRD